MNVCLTQQQKEEFVKRGFSRRNFGRLAAMLTAGAALPFYNEPAMAQLSAIRGGIPADAVKINANENPLGPCEDAPQRSTTVAKNGGTISVRGDLRFPGIAGRAGRAEAELRAAVRRVERAAASGGAGVHFAYEAVRDRRSGVRSAGARGRFIGAKVIRVPLTKSYAHDVKGDGRGKPGCRADLRVQPEQPDRDADAAKPRSSGCWRTSRRAASCCSTKPTYTSPERPCARTWWRRTKTS